MPRLNIEAHGEVTSYDFCSFCWPPDSTVKPEISGRSRVSLARVASEIVRAGKEGDGHSPYRDNAQQCFGCGTDLLEED